MADDRLEALIALSVLGLPEFDCTVCTCGDQDIKTIDLSADKLSDFTFVRLR